MMPKSNLLIRVPVITIGAIGTCMAGYNIIVDGKRHADEAVQEELSEHYINMYHKIKSSPTESELLEKTKNYFSLQMFDSNIFPFIYRVKNSIAIGAHEVLDNFTLLSASMLALCGPLLHDKYKDGSLKNMVLKSFVVAGKASRCVANFVKSSGLTSKIISVIKKIPKHLKSMGPGHSIAAVSGGLLALGLLNTFRKEVLGIGKHSE